MTKLINDYSNVIKSFEEFKAAQSQDCTLISLFKLSNVIENLKAYCYINEQEFLWKKVISHLYFNNKPQLYIDYADLEECFIRTINIENINHWQNLSLFLEEIAGFSKYYNLNIRDFIRMNYINSNSLNYATNS